MRRFVVCVASAAVLSVAVVPAAAASSVIGFESVAPRNPALAGNYWSPNPGFSAGGVSFNGGSFSGLAVSNSTNLTDSEYLFFGTPGGRSEISAYALPAGGGAGGSANFAVAYNVSTIDLPAGVFPASVSVTNTTLTYKTLLSGDAFGFSKKFGGSSGSDPDFFKVIFGGFTGAGATGSPTGSVEFFLADYRSADNALDYIVSAWTAVDLSPLGAARSVRISFASSDVGQFGINTPVYVALDDFTVVPEPAAAGLLCAALPLVSRRRRR